MLGAFYDNEQFIRKRINDYSRDRRNLKILDVGCAEGKMTLKFLSGIRKNTFEIYGLDVLAKCRNKMIKYKNVDLEGGRFPHTNNFFDIVYSNQVLEHILDKDNFISECNRVLKIGGLFILSTENIASFDNIVSVLFGQEPISQHTGSKFNTQSFFSPHFMQKNSNKEGNKYLHKNVCSYYGLIRLAKINGFPGIKIKSFGHINKIFEVFFPIYNRLIIIYGYKN